MPPKQKSSPPKAGGPPKPMASIGQSRAVVQARAKQLKDGNAFLNYIKTASEDGELTTRWGTVWEEVSEEELGQRDIWRRTSSRSTGSRKASGALVGSWTSTPRTASGPA